MIARYDVCGGILSVAHQAINTIYQNPMDGKKIGNGVRLVRLLENYTMGVDYAHCLSWQADSAMIREFKSGKREVLPEHAPVLLARLEEFIENASAYPGPCRELDVPLDNFMMKLLQTRSELDK